LKEYFYIFVSTALRKLSVILLLLITCISYIGYYFVYAVQAYYAKEKAALKILHQLPDNQLTRIEITRHLNWEGDSEFWYENKMYDVIRKTSENGRMYVVCIADGEEMEAIKNLSGLVHFGAPSNNPGKTPLKIKNALPDFFCTQLNQKQEGAIRFNNCILFNDYAPSLCKINKKILVPPPKA
jgi:hypothetical protein